MKLETTACQENALMPFVFVLTKNIARMPSVSKQLERHTQLTVNYRCSETSGSIIPCVKTYFFPKVIFGKRPKIKYPMHDNILRKIQYPHFKKYLNCIVRK